MVEIRNVGVVELALMICTEPRELRDGLLRVCRQEEKWYSWNDFNFSPLSAAFRGPYYEDPREAVRNVPKENEDYVASRNSQRNTCTKLRRETPIRHSFSCLGVKLASKYFDTKTK